MHKNDIIVVMYVSKLQAVLQFFHIALWRPTLKKMPNKNGEQIKNRKQKGHF